MRILVTEASSFVGRNLCARLRSIRDGEARSYGWGGKAMPQDDIAIDSVYEFEHGTPAELDEYCAEADFVFNLAGAKRPEVGKALIKALRKHENKCPVMVSCSEYGNESEAVEKMFFEYGADCDVKVLVYRFPHIFGKWCSSRQESPVAAFCHGIAEGIDFPVPNPGAELELVYIDDLVDEMIACLRGKEHRCDYDGMGVYPIKDGKYCYVPTVHRATIGEIVDLLHTFEEQRKTLIIPPIPDGSFTKKLYSTYLTYLPEEKVAFPLRTKVDDRGSYTELVKTMAGGQFSVMTLQPGAATDMLWHNSKWEFYIVFSGRARICERRVETGDMWHFEVSGQEMQAVHMIPGYAHNITNLSDTEPLIVVMWANEVDDPARPDTYADPFVM